MPVQLCHHGDGGGVSSGAVAGGFGELAAGRVSAVVAVVVGPAR